MQTEHPEEFHDPGYRNVSPRISDAVIVFISILLVWLGLSFLLSLEKPYLSERGMVYLSGFLTQGSMLVIVLSYIWWRRISLRNLGYRLVNRAKLGLPVLKAYLVVFALNVVYSIFLYVKGYTPTESKSYTVLLSQHDLTFVLLNLLLAGVIAPILEETVFRGIIYNSLRSKLGVWTAAILSAALFSGLHMDFWGFVPRFFLGMALAYLYEKNQSLFPSMALHSLNNTLALLINLVVKMPG